MDKPEDLRSIAYRVLDEIADSPRFQADIIHDALISTQSQAYIDAARIADEYVWDEHELAQATDVGRARHRQARSISAAILSRKDEVTGK